MKVLLTGITSFIGGHLALALADSGHTVVGTCRTLKSPQCRALTERMTVVDLDLTNPYSFSALDGPFDAAIHVAGVSELHSNTSENVVDVNILGTQNLIRFCRIAEVSKVIFASTMSVYGRPCAGSMVDQNTAISNPGVYGASKFFAERLLEHSGLSCIALRLPGVLGVGAHRAWLPKLAERIAAGSDVTIYNPKELFNNGTHISDLCRFVNRLLCNEWVGFHAFPIGAHGVTTIENAVGLLMEGLGIEVPVKIADAPSGNFLISSNLAIKDFGYAPMNIEDMISYYASEVRSKQGSISYI